MVWWYLLKRGLVRSLLTRENEDYMEVHIYLIPIYYLGQSARTGALCDTLDTLWDIIAKPTSVACLTCLGYRLTTLLTGFGNSKLSWRRCHPGAWRNKAEDTMYAYFDEAATGSLVTGSVVSFDRFWGLRTGFVVSGPVLWSLDRFCFIAMGFRVGVLFL